MNNLTDTEKYSDEAYGRMVNALFWRFPSFQKAGAEAYKPGIGNMMFFDQLSGHPHGRYMTIHVAGTNGKGSVASMLASVCAASGLRTGLYTSPHLLDFRERMRIVEPGSASGSREGGVRYISREEVWNYVQEWEETFDHLDLSFFEITTMMAFDWFAAMDVDIAVIETGLGGRLDSTNIITPVMSVITCIGLDHCDMLGNTLGEIAFEKAGIIKPEVPVVIGESNPETDPVFERKVLYTNLSVPDFNGDRNRIMSLLTFADKVEPSLWKDSAGILERMDLQGKYQARNLRTALAAVDVLAAKGIIPGGITAAQDGERDEVPAFRREVEEALVHTAGRTEFHGRWEKLSDTPCVICDIGHNPHALKYNFSQLEEMMASGRFNRLTVVYGAMADKDVDGVMRLLPECAEPVFVTAPGKRAMPAEEIMEKYVAAGGDPSRAVCCSDIRSALEAAGVLSAVRPDAARHLVYVGGSTYVVAEAVPYFVH